MSCIRPDPAKIQQPFAAQPAVLPVDKAACPLLKLEVGSAGASWDKGFFSEKTRIEMVLQLMAYIFRCTRRKFRPD